MTQGHMPGQSDALRVRSPVFECVRVIALTVVSSLDRSRPKPTQPAISHTTLPNRLPALGAAAHVVIDQVEQFVRRRGGQDVVQRRTIH